MAEETGDINIPKVGTLPKKVVIPLAIGLAGFVGWRVYQSRKAAADTSGDVSDFDAQGTVPGVLGAVPPNNAFGDAGADTTDNGSNVGRFANNAEWTDYVVNKLTQAQTWTYDDIIVAIGNGIAGKPTTPIQQDILRAAIAVGGQPPGGPITIVSGGSTAPMTAPIMSRPTATDTTFHVDWQPVAGADHYVVKQSNGGSYTTTATDYTVTGLRPNTAYTFTVAAANAAGVVGPAGSTTGKTTATKLSAPAAPRIASITRAGGTATTAGIAGAEEYIWYVNNQEWAHTEGKTYIFHNLRPNTTYRITVAGDTHGQSTGPKSAAATLKTKK
jgi:chitodextrinase